MMMRKQHSDGFHHPTTISTCSSSFRSLRLWWMLEHGFLYDSAPTGGACYFPRDYTTRQEVITIILPPSLCYRSHPDDDRLDDSRWITHETTRIYWYSSSTPSSLQSESLKVSLVFGKVTRSLSIHIWKRSCPKNTLIWKISVLAQIPASVLCLPVPDRDT